MKSATVSKFLVAAMLVTAPVLTQAATTTRAGASLGKSEKQVGLGNLLAIFAAAAAVAGGAIALSGDETPTSA